MNDQAAQPGTVHLRLRIPARSSSTRAWAAGLADWLGTQETGQRDGTPIPDGPRPAVAGRPSRTIFRKAAYVDIGAPRSIEGGWRVPIGWRSATMAPLFPVFAGRLDVRADGLTLEGWYAPPGGEAGRIIDRALLNVAARGTARWFLDRVGAVLEAGHDVPSDDGVTAPAGFEARPQPR
jgi:hypothetical protein